MAEWIREETVLQAWVGDRLYRIMKTPRGTFDCLAGDRNIGEALSENAAKSLCLAHAAGGGSDNAP